jgi:hypothetical protein
MFRLAMVVFVLVMAAWLGSVAFNVVKAQRAALVDALQTQGA